MSPPATLAAWRIHKNKIIVTVICVNTAVSKLDVCRALVTALPCYGALEIVVFD